MGRGLSLLQMGILRLTLDRGGMLRVRDILEARWLWKPQAGKEQYDGGQVFDRASIGAQEYSKAHSTLSRTLGRLRKRGLIQVYKSKYGTAIGLTSAGEREAAQIHWETEAEAP